MHHTHTHTLPVRSLLYTCDAPYREWWVYNMYGWTRFRQDQAGCWLLIAFGVTLAVTTTTRSLQVVSTSAE